MENIDAVLPTGSSRQISFDFVPAGYDRSQEYTSTTRFGGFVPGTNTAWVVRMWQLNVDAMSPDPLNPDLIAANTPYSNSSVHVYHCPANSSASCW